MDEKLKGLLGLCARAGKLSAGHDCVRDSLRRRRSKLVILTSDASQRLKDEIVRAAGRVPTVTADFESGDCLAAFSKKVCVMSVDDGNFAAGILRRFGEINSKRPE